jgi:hypothetical protein
MAKWTRKKQERDDQKYFFNGNFIATRGILNALSKKEIKFIYFDVRQFADEQQGINFIQVYQDEKGREVWVIDQLDKDMVESGDYDTEDNHCTLLFPHEY